MAVELELGQVVCRVMWTLTRIPATLTYIVSEVWLGELPTTRRQSAGKERERESVSVA